MFDLAKVDVSLAGTFPSESDESRSAMLTSKLLLSSNLEEEIGDNVC